MYVFVFDYAGSLLLCGLFSSCGDWAYSIAVVHGLLIAVSSLVEHGLSGVQASVVGARGLSSYRSWALQYRLNNCGTGAQLFHSVCDIPGLGLKPCLLHSQVVSLPLRRQGSPSLLNF